MDGQRHAPASLPPGKSPLPIVHEAGCTAESVWMGPEDLASTGVRTADCPARIRSLYRLRYHGRPYMYVIKSIFVRGVVRKQIQQIGYCAVYKTDQVEFNSNNKVPGTVAYRLEKSVLRLFPFSFEENGYR